MNKIVNVNYEYPPEITAKSKSFIDRILKKNPESRIDIDQVLKDRFLEIWSNLLFTHLSSIQ